MFKDLTIYRIAPLFVPELADIEAALAKAPFMECGATEMVQASAPVVLPAPDVFAKVSHKGAAKWDVEFTWPVGKFEEDGDHKLYTEQQVRAMLAAAPKPPAHEPGQHGSAYPAHGITDAPNGGDHGR